MQESTATILPQWTLGYPPTEDPCYLSCRKWFGTYNGQYFEVVAGDPGPFLKHLGIPVVLRSGFTGLFGRVVKRGNVPFILNEHGGPTGFYPDCVLAWSPPPEVMLDLEAAASARMAVEQARSSSQ